MEFGEEEETSVGFQIMPMVDIIFLLLIFFMLVTVLKQSAEYVQDLPKATEGEQILGKSGQVSVNITEDGRIVVGHTIYEIPGFQAYLMNVGEPSRLSVYIRGDRKVAWKEIMKTIKACAQIGIGDISFGVYQKGMGGVK